MIRGFVLGVVVAALIGSAVAWATVSQVFTVKAGGRADFPVKTAPWSCFNAGSYVRCGSGDAFPYVDLTTIKGGGITVRVHTLKDPQGGRVIRSYDSRRNPLYTFTAF